MEKKVEAGEHEEFRAKDYMDPPPAPLIDVKELSKWSLYRAIIAEFIATLIFLYITIATVIGYKSSVDPVKNTAAGAACGGVGILGIAWAFGGMIFILVYCIAGISEKMETDVEAGEHEEFIGVKELSKWSLYRALIAEFIATLIFLYITIATVIGYKSSVDPAAGAACSGVGILGIAWAFGGMIFILVYCIAGISGGHINPAVTFGLFLARRVSLIRAVLHIVAQCLGGICGVGLVKGFQKSYYVRYGGGANVVADGYSNGAALGAEIIGTFFLVYTVFTATDPKRKARDSHVPVLAPIPIGFAVFMVHLATIPITGTGINPARSFGAAVIYNKEKAWDDQWIFWIGPFIGAALAAVYHQFVLRAAATKVTLSNRSNPPI